MRKIGFFIFCSIMFLWTFNVNALSACSYSEQAKLNEEVANIKISYEEKERNFDKSTILCGPDEEVECDEIKSTENYFEVHILNMSENFYINAKSEQGFARVFRYSDVKDGIITFEVNDVSKVQNFTFTVISTAKTSCVGETFRTIKLTTPRYNSYIDYGVCDGLDDYYLCEKYVTFEKMSYSDFVSKVKTYKNEKKQAEEEEKNKSSLDKIKSFIVEHKTPILITLGVVLVAGASAAVVITIRRKKSVL